MECYVCCEEGGDLRSSPCLCKNLFIHPRCQENLVRSLGGSCTACRTRYANVSCRQVWVVPSQTRLASALLLCALILMGALTALVFLYAKALWQVLPVALVCSVSIAWLGIGLLVAVLTRSGLLACERMRVWVVEAGAEGRPSRDFAGGAEQP